MSRRVIEAVKTAVIVLLVISAVALGLYSRIFPIPGGAGSQSGTSGDPSQTFGESRGAAKPMCIAVTGQDGTHTAAKYDGEELTSVFEKTVKLFSEALGSAGEPTAVDEARWREFLLSPGVYYEYYEPVPMAVLCAWLGTEAGVMESSNVAALCLSSDRLCFRDGTGACFECATAVPADAVQGLGELCSERAVFAFELDTLEAFGCGSQLLFPDSAAHRLAVSSEPMIGQEARYELLEALDAAVFERSGYMEGDGTYVYVATDFTLRISPDGAVAYRFSGEAQRRQSTFFGDIEQAERICSKLLPLFAGDADYCYAGTVTAGSVTVTAFDYCIAGGLLSLPDGAHAASITLEEGVVTEMDLRLHRFSLVEEERELLPEIQTAAASAGGFRLVYDGAAGEYLPRWTLLGAAE